MRNDSPITDLIREAGCLIGDNRSCTTLTLNRSTLAQTPFMVHCRMLYCLCSNSSRTGMRVLLAGHIPHVDAYFKFQIGPAADT